MDSPESAPELLTVREVSKLLRVGRDTAYELVKTGAVPSIRFGRQIRIPRAALLRYIEDTAGTAAADR